MRVFLSSTYEDLKDHRLALEDSFAVSGIPYNAMEHFGADGHPPIETCLNAVRNSDVFVGVLGVRYGSCPPNRKKSFTEREYLEAIRQGMSPLLFLIDMGRAQVVPAHMTAETGDAQQRLERLKHLVARKHTVSYFTSPDYLAHLVLASLIRQFGVLP